MTGSLLSAKQVSERCGCSDATARRIMEDVGAVRPRGAGGIVRVEAEALESYLARCRVPGKAPASTGAPAAQAGGPTSTATTRTSLSGRKTKQRPPTASPDSSGIVSLLEYLESRRPRNRSASSSTNASAAPK